MDTPSAEVTQSTEAPKKNWSLLASEAFGSDFKGEVAQETPEVTQDDAPEVEAAAELPEADDSGEEFEQEGEAEQGEGEEAPISSFSELVEHYQLDPEWMDSLEVDVKINGEGGKAKLADLKASYQMKEAAEERLRDSKERSRAEMSAMTERREALNSEYAKAAGLIEKAEKYLTADESKIDWQRLREQDPAEWSAKKEEFKQRKSDIEAMKQEAVSAYQQSASKAQEQTKAQQQQYLQEQSQMLVEKLPEWKDPEVAQAEKTAVAKYLIGQGFSQEDISSAADHRMIVMARKAMLYDKGSDKSQVIQKKVTKIPKVLKPGTTKSTEQLSQEQFNKQKARLRSTGSLDDAVALMRAKRKGI